MIPEQYLWARNPVRPATQAAYMIRSVTRMGYSSEARVQYPLVQLYMIGRKDVDLPLARN